MFVKAISSELVRDDGSKIKVIKKDIIGGYFLFCVLPECSPSVKV